jgi:hypothetical protein
MLHFNSNATEATGKDALHKTRPLLKILRNTLGVFLIPGSAMSLDEASCASRSSYGRELIFYNPSKNCGKFHFRFYLPCDESTFVCLTLNVADGYVRMAVCEFAKMQAFFWNDNNPVHILSTADSSQERITVWRQRNAAKLQIPCPRAIPMYNDRM